MRRGKVLVLGDDTRGFLATVRSLGRQGVVVHAAPTNFRSPALLSRYIGAVHDLPPWMGSGADWLAAMAALLRAEQFDLVIPCDERTLLPLQRHRTQLAALTTLAIPDDPGIAALFDKHSTRELARQVGVNVSPGRLARAEDTAAGLLAEFGAPVVVKPRQSYSLDGLATRGRVHVLGTEPELAAVLEGIDRDGTLFEGYFAGDGLGVSILASGGRLLQAFEHHRVREQSGSSYYRISAALNPDLVQACAAVAGAIQYTGVAMFEFKRNAAGGWILLEVNARPWGSLPLPVALGVDFPYRWFRLMVEHEETPPVEYRTGVYGRNLMQDLVATRLEAHALHLGLATYLRFMAGRAAELLRLVTGREVHDVLVRDDLRPGLAEIGRGLAKAVRRAARLLPGTAGRTQVQARAQVAAAARGGKPVRVLFVCQGNICRSPYAEHLLLQVAPSAVEAASAGMMPRPGRPTPDTGVAAAAMEGVCLSEHRSSWLTRAMADAAALIVVFDDINVEAIQDRYPDLATPVVKLGALLGEDDIADPVDGGPPVFQAAYARIGRGVTELGRLLA